MIRTLRKIEIERNCLNLIKGTYKKPTLNNERLNAFLLKSGTRQVYPLSSLLFNIVLEVLASVTRPKKELKGTQMRNKTVPICRWHDHLHRKSQKIYKKRSCRIGEFSKVTGYKINIQKQIVFLYTRNEHMDTIKNTILFVITQNN